MKTCKHCGARQWVQGSTLQVEPHRPSCIQLEGKLDWDDLIKEAEARIKTMKRSLAYFREMKELGQIFPVDMPKPESEDYYCDIQL